VSEGSNTFHVENKKNQKLMTGCFSSHLYFVSMVLDSILMPITTTGLGVSIQSVRHNSFGRTS
jgi:hypothetical protein